MDVFLCFCVNLNKRRVCDTFFAQANSLQVCFAQTFCNVYTFFVRCNFIVEIACAFVQVLQKSFASEKQSDAKAFCFVWQIVSSFCNGIEILLPFARCGAHLYQSSAPASISILSLGEVGLLSPCLTNIIVTKDSTTNTVA